MENNFIKERVSFLKDNNRSCLLHKFEEDCIIPDYDAEIMRILCCKATPYISNKSISADKLTIDICVEYMITYQSYDMKIYTFKHESNYVKTIDLSDNTDEYNLSVVLNTTDCVCKATGKRKLDIKGTVKIDITQYQRIDLEVINSLTDEFETHFESFSANLLDIYSEKHLSLKEEVNEELQGLTVIDSFCKASVNDYRVVADKVVIKGEVTCYAVTLDEDLSVGIKSFTYQFGQIIEAEGVTEEHNCIVDAEGICCKFEENGCFITIKLSCRCFKEVNVNYISDCFSVMKNIECKWEDKSIVNFINKDRKTIRTNVSFGKLNEDITKINYYNISLKNCDANIDGDDVILKISALCSYIGSDDSNTCVGYEKLQEFDVKLDNACCDMSSCISAKASLKSSERDENDSDLSFNIELDVTLQTCKTEKVNILTDVSMISDKESKANRNTALTIYYAQSGERIFDIAKKYETRIKYIMEENDLENEKLYSSKHLIIPLL